MEIKPHYLFERFSDLVVCTHARIQACARVERSQDGAEEHNVGHADSQWNEGNPSRCWKCSKAPSYDTDFQFRKFCLFNVTNVASTNEMHVASWVLFWTVQRQSEVSSQNSLHLTRSSGSSSGGGSSI